MQLTRLACARNLTSLWKKTTREFMQVENTKKNVKNAAEITFPKNYTENFAN